MKQCDLCNEETTNQRYCDTCWRDPFRKSLIGVYEVTGLRADVARDIKTLKELNSRLVAELEYYKNRHVSRLQSAMLYLLLTDLVADRDADWYECQNKTLKESGVVKLDDKGYLVPDWGAYAELTKNAYDDFVFNNGE